MHYNLMAETLLRVLAHSSVCFSLAWSLDRFLRLSPWARLRIWNFAAILALTTSVAPLLAATGLGSWMCGAGSIYLNHVFRGSIFSDDPYSICTATVITWAWGFGTLGCLARCTVRNLRTRHELSKRRMCQDPQMLALLRHSAQRLGILDPIKLSVHPDFSSPVVASSQEICLSLDVLDLNQDQVLAVLGHELGHIERKDHQRLRLMELGDCLLWFLPLWSLFRGSTERCVEQICDQRGCQSAGSASAMAHALVAIAQRQRFRRQMLPALGPKRSELTQRVRALVSPCDFKRRDLPVVLMCLGACVTLLLAFQKYTPSIRMQEKNPAGCRCRADNNI